MVHLFNNDEARKIVWKQIEKDVSLGEQVGGSGHLSHVDCKIDSVARAYVLMLGIIVELHCLSG